MSSKTRSAQDWEWREGEADFSVPDDLTWKQMVINDLCGGKYKVNGAAVLNKLLLDFYHHLNTPALVKYLVDKYLLTDGERWALTQKPLSPQEKSLHLQQILMTKGENGLIEFYQCLLESCGLEPGLAGHYTLVQIIKRKVLFHDCSDMAELLQQEREPGQVVRQIKVVQISSETARSLIQRLHLEECNIDIGKITTQDIAKHWLATDKTKDWKVLVEAFLTERGCGCSVSGVLPLSESNPPEVWHFVRRLNQNWTHFAEFLGFPSRLICDIQSAWNHDPKAQIKSFMRMSLIPDCGDEKIRAIIQQIAHHMPVCRDPLISTKVERNINEDEKEDLPSEVRAPNFDGWGAAPGSVVVCQVEDLLKVIKQQKHTGASRVYQGGAALITGSRSDLYADETVFTKDNSAGYGTLHSTRGQETAGETRSDLKPQDMKASELTVLKKQSLDVHSASEDDSGRDVLQACVHGSWDFVKQSVSPMSNLEACNKNGRTALHICCIKENTEIVILLLQNGADVTTVDNEGNCCLHFRETLKNEALVEVLVEEFKKKNTTLDLLNKNGLTPLMVACLTNSDLCTKSAIHLLTNGAAIDGPPDVYSVPLIHASAVGNKWMVETLLLYGANINKQDQDGSTALIQVCLCNHTDIAERLLEAGADVNKAERNGTAALAAAITRNSFEMVQKLLEKGANPNAIRLISGEVEETPLAFTCSHGLRDIAQLLIVHGAKVNYMCSRQVPAIGFAIIGRQQGMVDFMLQVEDFNKTVYGLAIPMNIAMSVDNLEAAKAVLDVLGGPQKALELAQEKNHDQFKQDISLFIAVGDDALMISQRQPTAHSFESEARNQRVKVQQTLQTFSQICMSAIMANRDHDFIVEYATADNLPHVAVFFRDYFDRPQRADVLKANFLSRDHGISPLNFSIERNIINSDDFQVHALEFFPESPDQFYSDLVWSFHQISGGEDLSWDAPSVLQRLFSGSFSLNVDSSIADTHTQTQDFPDADQTPSPMSGATAHRQRHMAASEPMRTASLPSTLSSTTYAVSEASRTDAARMVQSHNPVRSSSNVQSALAHTHLQTQQNFSDANHTPNPISWNTANAQLFTTSLPMSNASQPSTLFNTTYDATQTPSPMPGATAHINQPHLTSSLPMPTASQPPIATLPNTAYDTNHTSSPISRVTASAQPHMASLPMSFAAQPSTLSTTAYDKKLLEEAMKEGYIKASFSKVIFTGAGGVGKTHTICLLRGADPPDPNHRQSTDCATKAVTLRVDATNDEKWEEIDLEKRKKIIAEGICAAKQRTKVKKTLPTPSPRKPQPRPKPKPKPEQQQPEADSKPNPEQQQPEAEPKPDPEQQQPEAEPKPNPEQQQPEAEPKPNPKQQQPEAVSKPNPEQQQLEAVSKPNPEQQQPEAVPKPNPEQQQPEADPKPQVEVQQEQQLPQSQPLETELDLVKCIHEAVMSGEVSGEVLGTKWVYVVDTGGQPPFHELLSAFIKGASVCSFVFKLSESLDHRPLVEYWVDGTEVGQPFEHPLSNRQILEQSIQTIQALPGLSNEYSKSEYSTSPLLLVIGTHRDKQDECTEETLEDKEKILRDILEKSGCNFQYNTQNVVERVIFDVNAKTPEQKDKKIASTLRRVIASKMPKPTEIPLRHYGLELELEHLATTKPVISMEECRAIGGRLRFNEEGLKAALRFLHRLNVLLYYPEVKEVEELLFCDPLVLFKISSKVVEHIHKGATKAWKDSGERGLITVEQLNGTEFHHYFNSKIFTPNCLFKLFEHLLIVAVVKEKDQLFFMPCLLDELETKDLEKKRPYSCNPLTFQFRKEGRPVYAPIGLFSALVAFLHSLTVRDSKLCSWVIAESSGKLYRNIIKFHSHSPPVDITLMNFHTRFEVFPICQRNVLHKHLPKIRSIILKGLEEAKKVRNFEQVDYKEAFRCKCPKGISKPHFAEIDIGEKSWSCPHNPAEGGPLERTELVWYEESSASGGGDSDGGDNGGCYSSSSGGTAGYSKLQSKRDKIIKNLADLGFTGDLAEKLLRAKMITPHIYNQAKNIAPGVVEIDRSTVLFNAVLASVELNPVKYNKFISILREICASEDLVAFIEGTDPCAQPTDNISCGQPTGNLSQTEESVPEICCFDLDFGDQLGEGAFDVVYRGHWKSRDILVAIKRVPGKFNRTEIETLSKLRHPCIIKFHGLLVDRRGPPEHYIITELAEGGSLYDRLHRKNIKPSQEESVRWAAQIAEGMKYLHQEKMMHGDLKSSNVLLTGEGNIKICDFGGAKYFDYTTMQTVTGTYRWMAPEVMRGEPVSLSSDVFSYGMLLYEILTGKLPFADAKTDLVVSSKIMSGEIPPILDFMESYLAKILKQCWNANPKARPSFRDILEILTNRGLTPRLQLTKIPHPVQVYRQCSIPEQTLLRRREYHLQIYRRPKASSTPGKGSPPRLQPSKIPRPIYVYRQCSTPEETLFKSKRQREPVYPRSKVFSPPARGPPPRLQPTKIPRPVRVYRQCSTPVENLSTSKSQTESVYPRSKVFSPPARGPPPRFQPIKIPGSDREQRYLKGKGKESTTHQ